MHIEKNFCENIINAIMDVHERTKDNAKSRMDIANIWIKKNYIYS